MLRTFVSTLPVACALLLSAPALAQHTTSTSSTGGTTLEFDPSCADVAAGNETATCTTTPETVRVPPGTTTVSLTLVNNATVALRIDVCTPTASSDNGTSGGSTSASGGYAPCQTGVTSNGTSGAGNATGGTVSSGSTGTGAAATGTCAQAGGTTNGPASGTNGTSGNATFPVTVPACGQVTVTVKVPSTGAVGIVLADAGKIVSAITTSADASGGSNGTTGSTNTTEASGNTTVGGNGTNESTGTTSKGTPGFEGALLVGGLAVVALALSRRS